MNSKTFKKNLLPLICGKNYIQYEATFEIAILNFHWSAIENLFICSRIQKKNKKN